MIKYNVIPTLIARPACTACEKWADTYYCSACNPPLGDDLQARYDAEQEEMRQSLMTFGEFMYGDD